MDLQNENINLKLRKYAFTKWVNYMLPREENIEELEYSISDGFFLLKLILILKNQKIPKDKAVLNELAKFENMRKAFDIMKNDGLKFAQITPQDILNSPENVDAILQVVWALIVRYHVLHRDSGFLPLPSDSHIKKVTLTWINSLIPDSKITNFGADWADGTALKALINYCERKVNPNWVNLKQSKRPGQDLLLHCLSLAEERYSIPDIMGGRLSHAQVIIDERVMITYLAFFTLHSEEGSAPDRSNHPIGSGDGPVPACVRDWINSKLEPTRSVRNWRGDWMDGKVLQELVNSFSNHYLAPCAPTEDKDKENLFKNANHSILEDSMNKAKELGVQPLISARELRSGKLNTLYMIAYVSQFVRLDTNMSKKKTLHDELTQKFRVIKRELRHIPPMDLTSPPKQQKFPKIGIPMNLATEIKEVYHKRLLLNQNQPPAQNMDSERPLTDRRDWTNFASIKNTFDQSTTVSGSPTHDKTSCIGRSKMANKVKLAKMAAGRSNCHKVNPSSTRESSSLGSDTVKADPNLFDHGDGTAFTPEIRTFIILDHLPAILPVDTKLCYAVAVAKSKAMPFRNDSLALWIHPPSSSKLAKFQGTIQVSQVDTSRKDFKNVPLPPDVSAVDLFDLEKFDIYDASFAVRGIGEHKLQLILNGKEIYARKASDPNAKGSDPVTLTFKVYDVAKVIFRTPPYCIRDLMTTITISAKDSGPGKLEVLINNGITKSTIRNLGGKRFGVDFIPAKVEVVPGPSSPVPTTDPDDSQIIEIRFNGQQIPKSPIVCRLLDFDKVSFDGKGLGPAIRIKTPVSFVINTHQPVLRVQDLKIAIIPITVPNDRTDKGTKVPAPLITITKLHEGAIFDGSFLIAYNLSRVGFYALNAYVADPSSSLSSPENICITGDEQNGPAHDGDHSFIPVPIVEVGDGDVDKRTAMAVILKAFDPSAIRLTDSSLLSRKIALPTGPDPHFHFNIEIDGCAGEGHLELAVDDGIVPNTVQLITEPCGPRNDKDTEQKSNCVSGRNDSNRSGAPKICRVSFVPVRDSHTVQVKFNGHPVPRSPFELSFLPPQTRLVQPPVENLKQTPSEDKDLAANCSTPKGSGGGGKMQRGDQGETMSYLKLVLGPDIEEFIGTESPVTQISRNDLRTGDPYACRIYTNQPFGESALHLTIVACESRASGHTDTVSYALRKLGVGTPGPKGSKEDEVQEYLVEFSIPGSGNYELSIQSRSFNNIGIRVILRAVPRLKFPQAESIRSEAEFGFLGEDLIIRVELEHDSYSNETFGAYLIHEDKERMVKGTLLSRPPDSKLTPIKFILQNVGINLIRFVSADGEIKDYDHKIYVFPSSSPTFNPPSAHAKSKTFYNEALVTPSFFFPEPSLLNHVCETFQGKSTSLIFEVGKVYHIESLNLPFLQFLTLHCSLNSQNSSISEGENGVADQFQSQIIGDIIELTFTPKVAGPYTFCMACQGRKLVEMFIQAIDTAAICFLKNEWSAEYLKEGTAYHLEMDLSKSGGTGPLFVEVSDTDTFSSTPTKLIEKAVGTSADDLPLDCLHFYTCKISELPGDVVSLELQFGSGDRSRNLPKTSPAIPKSFDVAVKGWPNLPSYNNSCHVSIAVFRVTVTFGHNSDPSVGIGGEGDDNMVDEDRIQLLEGFGALYPSESRDSDVTESSAVVQAFRPTHFLIRSRDPIVCSITDPNDTTKLTNHHIRERHKDSTLTTADPTVTASSHKVWAVEFVPCRIGRYRVRVHPRGADDSTKQLIVFDFHVHDVRKVVTSFFSGFPSTNLLLQRLISPPPLILNEVIGIEVDCTKSGGMGTLDVEILNTSDPESEPIVYDLRPVTSEEKYLITFVPPHWAPSYEIHLHMNKEPLPGSPFVATFSQIRSSDSRESIASGELQNSLPIKYIDSVTNSYTEAPVTTSATTKSPLFSSSDPIATENTYQELDAIVESLHQSAPTLKQIAPKLLSSEVYNGKDVPKPPPLETVIGRPLHFSVDLPVRWCTRGNLDHIRATVDRELNGTIEIRESKVKYRIDVSCCPVHPGPHKFCFGPEVGASNETQNGPESSSSEMNLVTRVVNAFACQKNESQPTALHTSCITYPAAGVKGDRVRRGTRVTFPVFGSEILNPASVRVYGRVYPDDYQSRETRLTVTPNDDLGLDVTFVPDIIGELYVHVKVGDHDIHGSPMIFRIYDPTKIAVHNLKYGFLRNSKDTWFLIDAQDAGIGDLELVVATTAGIKVPNYVQLIEKRLEESLSPKVRTLNSGGVGVQGIKKTIFKVTFEPACTDDHTVDIKFNGDSVPGSPFTCFVIDPGQITLSGPNLIFAQAGKLNRFFVDMCKRYVGVIDITEIKAVITASGNVNHKKETIIPTTNIYKDNDRMVVEFKPIQVGAHDILISLKDVPIHNRRNGATNKDACHVFDPSLVCLGKLKERIKINKEYRISIDASKAGPGYVKATLSVSINPGLITHNHHNESSDPSQRLTSVSVPINLIPLFSTAERKEPSSLSGMCGETKYYEACYETQTPGKHTLEVTYNDVPIRGSPFLIEADKGKCILWGPGLCSFPLEHIPAYFHIDLKQAYSDHGIFSSRKKEKKLQVIILDPFGGTIPWKYREDFNGTECSSSPSSTNYLTPKGQHNPFTIQYYPVHAGKHSISLRYGNNVSIGGSPYSVSVYSQTPPPLPPENDTSPLVPCSGGGHTIEDHVIAKEIGHVGQVYSFIIQVPPPHTHQHPDMSIKPLYDGVTDDVMNVSYTLGRTGTKGKYQASFTPSTPRVHRIVATWDDGKMLAGFPLDVEVQKLRPVCRSLSPREMVRDANDAKNRRGPEGRKSTTSSLGIIALSSPYATGPGLYDTIVNESTSFTLHDCPTSEEIDVLITGPNNSLVPCKCFHQQQNGEYRVEYTPRIIGKYEIDITIGTSKIMGNPYTCNAFDPLKVKLSPVPQSSTKLTLGQEYVINADCLDAGDAELSLRCETTGYGEHLKVQDGVIRMKHVNDTRDYQLIFKPRRVGTYEISPTYGGRDILGSPLIFIVNEPPLIHNNKIQLRATGEGLLKGIQGQVCRFKIFLDNGDNCKGAVCDQNQAETMPSLKVLIEGPNSLPEAHVHRHDNGACSVTYVADEIGSFKITVLGGGDVDHHSSSLGPYFAQICNPHSIKVITTEEGPLELLKGVEKSIALDASSAGPGTLTTDIQALTSKDSRLIDIPHKVEKAGHTSDTYYVIFNPKYQGEYYVHLKWNGYSLPDSPLVGRCTSTTKIPEYDTKSTMCDVIERLLTNGAVGGYAISGPGIGPRVLPNQPYHLTLDFGSMYQSIMTRCTDIDVGANNSIEHILDPILKLIPEPPNNSGIVPVILSGITFPLYKYSYEIREPGQYNLRVCLRRSVNNNTTSKAIFQPIHHCPEGDLIDLVGSPYPINCSDPIQPLPPTNTHHRGINGTSARERSTKSNHGEENGHDCNDTNSGPYDPNACKVKVFGPGIKSGVLAHFQSQFTIDTKGACAGQLTVKIRGPKSAFHVNMRRDATRDRVIHCQYDPTEPGDYHVHVKWSGYHVTGSPFIVIIYDTFQELKESTSHESADYDTDHQTSTLEPAPNINYTNRHHSKSVFRVMEDSDDIRLNNSSTRNVSSARNNSNNITTTTNKCIRGFSTLSYEEWRKL